MRAADRDSLEGTAYRPIALLGRGGMGEVWEVEHRQSRRRFAAKLLSAGSDEGLLERFRVEAAVLGRVEHPNVVGIEDVGVSPAGRAFYVMERLRPSTPPCP